MGYQEDMVKALQREADLIKKQTILEMIQIVTECDTYEEFKKTMYGMAIKYFREMEAEGLVAPGTVDRIINDPSTTNTKTKEPEMTDDMFLI